MVKIAIVGAGFCGLGTAWHLLQHSDFKVTLFDAAGVAGGASGIAAGLLHPYAGLHAKLNWQGLEGVAATKHLLNIAAQHIGRPVAEEAGLLRLAITEKQLKGYALCAENYPDDVVWQPRIDLPGITPYPGIFIKSALTVNCNLYLQGLFKACQEKGASLEKIQVQSPQDLKEFDAIVIATGASVLKFSELTNLPITPVKGQILEFNWPAHLPHLPCPVNSQAYLIHEPLTKSCLVGSTYEKNFKDEKPDCESALAELTPKFSIFLPFLNRSDLIVCKAGIRASTPDHLPIIKQISSKMWVLTGMGSKGLLYHALMAEQLTRQLAAQL